MSISKNPTIYDVAHLAGVSVTTVSRVLNSPDKVNPNTRERIQSAIDNLGFIPKAEARARALQRTWRIGVITPFLTSPAFVQRLRGIARSLSSVNYDLVIYTVDSVDQLRGYLSSLPLTGNLDGLILLSLPVTDAEVERLIKSEIPAVLVEYPHPQLSCVEIDDEEGGRMVAEYLISKGHQRIAFIGESDLPEYAIRPVNLRLRGFSKALREAGHPMPDEFVRQCDGSLEDAQRVALQLLKTEERPTAIFGATDYWALGVIKAARQLNVGIPNELAVIGFDDIDMADFEDLTTISQHLDESGRLAAEIIISQIENPTRLARHVKLPLTFMQRQTA